MKTNKKELRTTKMLCGDVILLPNKEEDAVEGGVFRVKMGKNINYGTVLYAGDELPLKAGTIVAYYIGSSVSYPFAAAGAEIVTKENIIAVVE